MLGGKEVENATLRQVPLDEWTVDWEWMGGISGGFTGIHSEESRTGRKRSSSSTHRIHELNI
ncbi:uncharacterized protein N7511_004988 [Penicillium nucicola]|uniref:uncharacterized protein n=1 Tax=Penicillium nucicola TaxID=1850975 RepID=UPI0025451DD9|nr:uncharacterized protein N7511_004988 [Penicillium nucicola]KAJ5767372.1 hypothetical protein N7511_004988 [Penicillium nucicola]